MQRQGMPDDMDAWHIVFDAIETQKIEGPDLYIGFKGLNQLMHTHLAGFIASQVEEELNK